MDEALKLENYTYQDYLDIDQSTKERVELIFGKIYMMAGASAEHQDAVLNLGYILKNFTNSNPKCTPRIAPFDLKLMIQSETSVVQPDVMLFCENELPCAIFEVLSPSTAYKDKTVKKDLYEQNGVQEYFLVNVGFKIIEKFVLQNGKYIYDKTYGIEESITVECIDESFDVKEVFFL
ncbi:MAG: Uma2 family endonuclease [Epsilonproteobacteria bacterium]|nr:Uma2 family endonuclease [Campylobacterota bacterium]